MCNLLFNKCTLNQKTFYTILCVGIYINVLDSNYRLFLAGSRYYSFINYFNTNENTVLLLLLIYSVGVVTSKKYNTVRLTSVLLLFCCYSIFTEYTIFSSLLLYKQRANNNLLNGIMLIHPPILYLSYAYICVSTVTSTSNITQNYIQTKQFLKILMQTHFVQNVSLIFSILLGCWWAEQELSWGGWWSWDFVEVLALCICLYSLIHTHEKHVGRGYFRYFLFFLILAFSIISVRYNIINSIHNFSLTSTTNQNLYYLNTWIVFFAWGVFYMWCMGVSLTPNKPLTKYYNVTAIVVCLWFLVLYYFLHYYDIKIPVYSITCIVIIKIVFYMLVFLFCDFFYYGVFVIFVFFYTGSIHYYLLIFGVWLTTIRQKNNTTFINYFIHLFLLLFLWFSTLQYYIFYNSVPYLNNFTHVDLCLLKLNQFVSCLFTQQAVDCNIFYKSTLVSDLLNVYRDTITIPKGTVYENIFGKNVFTNNNVYVEKINQDNQLFMSFILYQIFIILALLIFFFIFAVFSKNSVVTI